MAKSKQRKSGSVSAGRDHTTISIQGNQNAVATHGGKAVVTHIENSAMGDFNIWREQMEREISKLRNLPKEDKSILKQNIEQITREAEKGGQVDTSRLERLLNALSAMAPDIFDVAVTTLANPLAGIGLAVKKIGEKAKVMQKA